MILRYAGVPLLLEDPGYKLQAWLDQNFSMKDLVPLSSASQDQQASSSRSRGTLLNREAPDVGLPAPNYASKYPPRWKINTLWWPTGASRHAIGLFLVGTAEKDLILSSAPYGTATLELGDSDSAEISATMRMLSPIQLSVEIGDEAIWLLVLVDGRYQWLQNGAGDLEVDKTTTWDGLYAKIETATGLTITRDAIHADYDQPDPIEWSRKYSSVGHLIDAVAASVGHRIVVSTSGAINSLSLASTNTIWTAASEGSRNMLSGGSGLPTYPESVVVTFPKRNLARRLWKDGDVYTKEVTADSLGFTGQVGLTTVFRSTAAADLGSASSTPANDSDLASLATQIATDFIGHLRRQYDVTYSGIEPWTFSGYDDYVWWGAGNQHRVETSYLLKNAQDDTQGDIWGQQRHYEMSTRVASHRSDFGVTSQLQQVLVDTRSGTSVIRGEVYANVTALNPTFELDNINVITGDDPRVDDTDATEKVTVTNRFAQEYAANDIMIAIQNESSNISSSYEPLEGAGAAGRPLIHFELTEDKAPTDSAKLAKEVLNTGLIDAAGDAFYVLDNSERFSGKAAWVGTYESDRGYRGYAEFYEADHSSTGKPSYKIIEMEQPTTGFVCELREAATPTSPKTYTVYSTEREPLEQQGSGRWPRAGLDQTMAWTVEDVHEITTGGDIESALIVWSTDEDAYIIATVYHPTYIRVRGQVKSTVLDSTATFDIDNIEVLAGEDPRVDPSSSTESLTVTNDPIIAADNNTVVEVLFDLEVGSDLETHWRPVMDRRHHTKVIIISSIVSADWDSSTDTMTPVAFTAWLLEMSGGVWKYNGNTIDAVSFYTTAISVGSGKGRFGYVSNGELIIVDCEEITL